MLIIKRVPERVINEFMDSSINFSIDCTYRDLGINYANIVIKQGIVKCYPNDSTITIDQCGRIGIIETTDFEKLEMI